MQRAQSSRAHRALDLVEALQTGFAHRLEAVSSQLNHRIRFERVRWLRDEGRHGGGARAVVPEETPIFNRASINVSQVHYDDMETKRLSSATALSTIIHPQHPLAPSVHAHISFTEMRDGSGYWRVMADLNPALPRDDDRERFRAALAEALGEHAEKAMEQGDRYFFIPALDRHRGVVHFYLEAYSSGAFEDDWAFAEGVGQAFIETYPALLEDRIASSEAPRADEQKAQLDYHSLYFLQVLTLDRGTTSGLLVHDQNDVGILGSLPAAVDRGLLETWVSKLKSPQDALLQQLIAELPEGHPSTVTEDVKAALARVVRAHYQSHPEALEMQARADVVPPTVANHV